MRTSMPWICTTLAVVSGCAAPPLTVEELEARSRPLDERCAAGRPDPHSRNTTTPRTTPEVRAEAAAAPRRGELESICSYRFF